MMDRNKILEDGLLERYFFDELTATEKKEIEKILSKNKDLQSQYQDLEYIFESIGKENAIDPPEHVKTHLFNSIKTDEKVIDLPTKNINKSNSFLLKIAASILPLLLFSTFWFFIKSNDLEKDLKLSKENYNTLREDLNLLKDQFNTQNVLYEEINNPDIEQYILVGNDKLPEAKLISYVNHKTKTVLVNTKKLPKPDAGKDYQMWADVDGEMINMGVIKKNDNLLAMNYIDDAESLNITIEPEGGSEHPTVSNLISNIYLR